MRGVGRLATTSVGPSTTKQALLLSSSAFSTSSSGGGGRGRGRGISSPFAPPAPGKVGPANDDYDASSADADDAFPPLGAGRGHGRGKPLPPPPVTNVFSPWMSSPPASVGRGRSQPPISPPSPQQPPPDPATKAPVFFRREDDHSDSAPKIDFVQTLEAGLVSRGAGRGQTVKPPATDTRTPVFFRREDADSEPARYMDFVRTPQASVLPPSISQGVRGAGRGQTVKPPETDTWPREENRHLRRGGRQPGSPSAPRLSREEAVEKAVGILRGPAEVGRGRRGRARGRDRGMQGGRGRGGRDGMRPRREIGEDGGAFTLDYSDEVKMWRQRLGEERTKMVDEALYEILDNVIPSREDDAFLDAVDTNFLVSQLCTIS